MDRQYIKKSHNSVLREKAEEQLINQKPKSNKLASETDMLKLIHELEVHQIELEMQNDELILAKEIAVLARNKYTELYNFAPSGYLSLTPQGDIAELNFMAASMLGKERSYLVNRKLEFYISENSRIIYHQFFQNIFSKTEKQSCSVTIALKGNAPVQVNIDGIVAQNHDHCFLTLTDITERVKSKIALRESEEKYDINKNDLKKAQSVAHIGNWKWDTATEECIWSDEMFQIFGVDQNAFQGKLCHVLQDVVHPEDLHLVTPFNSNKSSREIPVEYRIIMPDKSIRYIWSQAGETINNSSGQPLFFTGIVQDITKYKLTEIELIEAKEAAERATKLSETAKSKAEHATKIAEEAVSSKQQFLSNMSHEIRTPMNAIIGFTKVLQKTELTTKQKDYLNAIQMGGDTLIVIINDILDLAKVDAGKMTFKQSPFNIANSITTMLHLFELKIEGQNLFLIKEYDNKIPEVLLGDSVRLQQIILNLVGNAVKFTNKGKITVSVRLLSEEEESVNIEFVVADTGIGIPSDKIDQIFENFQQVYNNTSKMYGGTGLGLAIVKKLIESQGGSIHVESKLNEGSRFCFNLNFQKTNADAEYQEEMIKLDSDIKGLDILVVEDIYINQILMETMLADFGFSCDMAGNGKIAIDKLKYKTYDAILMDLQMPEMNGFKCTEYIRNTLNSDIPIIALTADVTTVGLEKCKAAGMNDYIAKPVAEKILYETIVGLVKKTFIHQEPVLIEKDLAINGKCTDLNYLTKRTKSDPRMLMKMISIYLDQTPLLISNMKQGWNKKDWELLYSSVHKLIPSFSIMGIGNNYENMAKQVQEYANTQLASETISELVTQLELVCIQACNELEMEYSIIKNSSTF